MNDDNIRMTKYKLYFKYFQYLDKDNIEAANEQIFLLKW